MEFLSHGSCYGILTIFLASESLIDLFIITFEIDHCECLQSFLRWGQFVNIVFSGLGIVRVLSFLASGDSLCL